MTPTRSFRVGPSVILVEKSTRFWFSPVYRSPCHSQGSPSPCPSCLTSNSSLPSNEDIARLLYIRLAASVRHYHPLAYCLVCLTCYYALDGRSSVTLHINILYAVIELIQDAVNAIVMMEVYILIGSHSALFGIYCL